MSREEDAVWAAILKSKKRLESAREAWGTLRFTGPVVQFFFGVVALVENQGWGDMVRVIFVLGAVILGNEILQMTFAGIELSTARAEAELAHRVDGHSAATDHNLLH